MKWNGFCLKPQSYRMIVYTAKVNQYTLLGHFLFGMFLSLTRSRKENHRITRSRSYPQDKTVPKIWTESLGSERAQKMAISIQLFSLPVHWSLHHTSLSLWIFFQANWTNSMLPLLSSAPGEASQLEFEVRKCRIFPMCFFISSSFFRSILQVMQVS